MKLGLGLGLNSYYSNGTIPIPAAPTALAATSPTATSFNANLLQGAHNVTEFIDVSVDSNFLSFVGSYNNFNIGNVVVYPIPGLSSQTQYYYRFRAALDILIQPPVLANSYYQQFLPVTWTGGTSDIGTVLNGISDATITNKYKVTVQGTVASPKVYPEQNLTGFDNYVSVFAEEDYGVTINSSGGTSNVFDLGGHNMTLQGFIMTQSNAGKYCVHVDSVPTNAEVVIVRNCKMTSIGSANWAAAGGLYAGQNVTFINCEFTCSAVEAVLYHNHTLAESSGDASGRRLLFYNCKFSGAGGVYTDFIYENRGSGSTTDFIAFYNCNIASIKIVNVAAGAGETYLYVDPSCGSPIINAVDPSKVLTPTQFATFLGTNNLSISDNSNTVSVTTSSEGNLPLDNFGGTVIGAWSTIRQLFTNNAGNGVKLFGSTPNTTQIFTLPVDQAAVATFKGAGTLGIDTLYDQSGNGKDFINATTATQPSYNIDGFKTGVPSIHTDGTKKLTLASPMTILDSNTAGQKFDAIVVINKETALAIFARSTPQLVFYQANGGSTLYFYQSGTPHITYSVPNSQNIELRIQAIVNGAVTWWINGVSVGSTTMTAITILFNELFNDDDGETYVGKFVEADIFLNGDNTKIAAYEANIVANLL
jgi:hypothetical protein